jgi:predicted RecA/RadA family phage recombinase
MPETGADLGGFLEAAGRSLVDAQGSLTGDIVDIPAAIAISEAELEVKAAVVRRADGVVALETISTQDMRAGNITPGLLSTVRVQYVAVGADSVVPPSEQPTKKPKDVIDGVRGREDVAILDKILGGLVFEAIYVPGRRSWLVTAKDEEQRLVREVLVPDEKR